MVYFYELVNNKPRYSCRYRVTKFMSFSRYQDLHADSEALSNIASLVTHQGIQ